MTTVRCRSLVTLLLVCLSLTQVLTGCAPAVGASMASSPVSPAAA